MRWYAIHHELAANAKFMDLTMEQRGAWLTLLTVAAAQEPRGTLRDRATAERLLRREGVAADAAAGLVAHLIGAGWIDDEDGALTFHDFDEWQLRTRKPSDWPDEIRERVARHRAKKKARKEEKEEIDEMRGEETRSNASNALHDVSDLIKPCPACESEVRVIDGRNGRFYRCGSCSWKSNDPPGDPIPRWTPSDADLAEIERQQAESMARTQEVMLSRESAA